MPPEEPEEPELTAEPELEEPEAPADPELEAVLEGAVVDPEALDDDRTPELELPEGDCAPIDALPEVAPEPPPSEEWLEDEHAASATAAAFTNRLRRALIRDILDVLGTTFRGRCGREPLPGARLRCGEQGGPLRGGHGKRPLGPFVVRGSCVSILTR